MATLNGCKCLLSIAVSDEAVVVTGEEDEARLGWLSGHMPWKTGTSQGTERDWGGSSYSPMANPLIVGVKLSFYIAEHTRARGKDQQASR